LEYVGRIRSRYEQARTRSAKGQILDELCEITGYHRKYALRLINGPGVRPQPRPRRRRPLYGPEVVRALVRIWTAAGYPWSARLKALMPLWLASASRHLGLSEEVQKQLLAISARQMDRRLSEHKRDLKKRLYGRTKPGSLLKHQIPLRTDRWRVDRPGYTEVDLVAHCGPSADGEFANSLNLTDIDSTWVETCAILGKSQRRTCEALETIRRRLPFPLLGIDSDNGSEFINEHLLGYCKQHQIQFTRGRPYKKDDNAHIEQKNWTHVRKIMGYERYEIQPAIDAMNRLYAGDLRLFQNFFMPSVKLLSKHRIGSRLTRRYDRPRTPLERLAGRKGVDRAKLQALRELRGQLDPMQLSASINRQLEQIYPLAQRWNNTSKPKKSPHTPWLNSYKGMKPQRTVGYFSNGATMGRKVTF
jgi:hypothetical protein